MPSQQNKKYYRKYQKYRDRYLQLQGGNRTHDCHCISCLFGRKGNLENGKPCECDCDCASNHCDYKVFSFHCGVCKNKYSLF